MINSNRRHVLPLKNCLDRFSNEVLSTIDHFAPIDQVGWGVMFDGVPPINSKYHQTIGIDSSGNTMPYDGEGWINSPTYIVVKRMCGKMEEFVVWVNTKLHKEKK